MVEAFAPQLFENPDLFNEVSSSCGDIFVYYLYTRKMFCFGGDPEIDIEDYIRFFGILMELSFSNLARKVLSMCEERMNFRTGFLLF